MVVPPILSDSIFTNLHFSSARLTRALSRLRHGADTNSVFMKPRFTIKSLLLFVALLSLWLFGQLTIDRNASELGSRFADPQTNCLVLEDCRLLHLGDVYINDRTTLLDRILFRKRITFTFDATFVDNKPQFGNEYTCRKCSCQSEFLVGIFSNEQVSLQKDVHTLYS